jgi:hypothetical protein
VTLDRWLAAPGDDDIREVVLRLGRLASQGRLERLVEAVRADGELDAETRSWMLRTAGDERFLLAAHCRSEQLRGLATIPGRGGD